MATFAAWDEATGIYDLGPPLNGVHEREIIDQAKNTPFEVAYWHFGLKVAQRWRERMGQAPDPLWQDVLEHLAPLEAKEGIYPESRGVFGHLPLARGFDQETLEKSIEHTVKNLRNGMCSWGYPQTAMAAVSTSQAIARSERSSPCEPG